MDRTGVRSSNIVAIGWEADPDSGNGTMEIEFKQGVVYQYAEVPEWVYRGLLYARSPGRYLLENIVEAYDGQRIE
jgi:hypothetical protein